MTRLERRHQEFLKIMSLNSVELVSNPDAERRTLAEICQSVHAMTTGAAELSAEDYLIETSLLKAALATWEVDANLHSSTAYDASVRHLIVMTLEEAEQKAKAQ